MDESCMNYTVGRILVCVCSYFDTAQIKELTWCRIPLPVKLYFMIEEFKQFYVTF